MNPTPSNGEDGRDEASAWHVRLNSDVVSEEDFAAFEVWVSVPANRDAYDRFDRLWVDVERIEGPVEPVTASNALTQFGVARRAWLFVGMAAAASALLFISLRPPPPNWSEFRTASSETREIRLADGSTVLLNRGSTLRVAIWRRSRRVVLDGEASFDVAPDVNRPFWVEAGDQIVRVVGTEFNVLHGEMATTVTVRRGIVEMGPATRPIRLQAGQQAIHRGDQTLVRRVDPDHAFAWRDGLLIYSDAPLGDVVSDLNRYFDHRLRIADNEVAALTFSGVLVVDSEDEVVARLEAFLPVVAERENDGIVLQSREP